VQILVSHEIFIIFFSNFTTYYAELKLYQYMLHQIVETCDTGNISNLTIISVMYLLQQAGELLEAIQVSYSYYCNLLYYFTTNIYSMRTTIIIVKINMIKWWPFWKNTEISQLRMFWTLYFKGGIGDVSSSTHKCSTLHHVLIMTSTNVTSIHHWTGC